MRRRAFLGTVGALGASVLTGCTEGFETRVIPAAPPVLSDRPDAVYLPTHVEGMAMAGRASAGPYEAALTYSYPHRFWTVSGRTRERVEIGPDDSVHLMVSLSDAETGVVPPTASPSIAIERDGEPITERTPWPMLSQNMGYHFGDNIALPGDGDYTVTARVDPMGIRRTGAFRDRFGEPATVELTFAFSETELGEVMFRTFDERAGSREAVPPMEMGMVSVGRLPPAEELPGRPIGTGTSGDGRFVVTVLDEPPTGVDGAGTYLAVSARTPYNRYPLPFMALSARLDRDGTTVFEGPLVATLDPDLDYHYGAAVDGIESGDELAIAVDAPPQVARHEGYETAFLEMAPMTFTVP